MPEFVEPQFQIDDIPLDGSLPPRTVAYRLLLSEINNDTFMGYLHFTSVHSLSVVKDKDDPHLVITPKEIEEEQLIGYMTRHLRQGLINFSNGQQPDSDQLAAFGRSINLLELLRTRALYQSSKCLGMRNPEGRPQSPEGFAEGLDSRSELEDLRIVRSAADDDSPPEGREGILSFLEHASGPMYSHYRREAAFLGKAKTVMRYLCEKVNVDVALPPPPERPQGRNL